jgi:hypothetical protein
MKKWQYNSALFLSVRDGGTYSVLLSCLGALARLRKAAISFLMTVCIFCLSNICYERFGGGGGLFINKVFINLMPRMAVWQFWLRAYNMAGSHSSYPLVKLGHCVSVSTETTRLPLVGVS